MIEDILSDDILDDYIDDGKLIIPTTKEILSIDIEQKLSSGVYLAKNRVYSLYGNKRHIQDVRWWDKKTAKKMLYEAKLLTKNKLFHPDTKWRIYKLLPEGCNLFSIYSNMPHLDNVKNCFTDEELERIVDKRIGHLCGRWGGVLPFYDASLERNWGIDNEMYMIDIDILRDISQSFYINNVDK